MRRELLDVVLRRAPRIREMMVKSLVVPRRIAFVDRTLRSTADLLLDCRTVRAHLSDWNDGELLAWQGALLRVHVASCLTCRPVYESLEKTLTLLRALRDEPCAHESIEP